MTSAERKIRKIRRWFVVALACPALLLLLNSVCSAQTINAAPDTIPDPANPQSVTLTILKANGQPDVETINNVDSVQVGGKKADHINADASQGKVTFNPPANLSGLQQVQLLDKAGKPLLGTTSLTYKSGSSPNTNSAQPDDIAHKRAESEIKRQDIVVDRWWYSLLIVIVFAIVLFVSVRVIAKSILFSKATFRSPLGLPVGSFRAILAYTLVAYLGFYILTSLLTISEFKPPDFLLGIVATVVGFYFGSRTSEEGSVDEKAGIVRGVVRKDTPGSGAPVSGALVKLKRDDGTEPYSRITDVDGRFVLQGAKAGKYSVSATATGASGKLEQLTITEGSDQEIEIVVKSASGSSGTQPAVGSVKGKVMQPDGKTAAVGSTITLTGNKPFTTKSAEDGSYTIDKIEAGQYTAVASLPDFAPSKQVSVQVGAGEEKRIDLKLETKS